MNDPVLVTCACGEEEHYASEHHFDATPGTMLIVSGAYGSLCAACETVRELVDAGISITTEADSSASSSTDEDDTDEELSMADLAELAHGGGTIQRAFERTDVLIPREEVRAVTGDSQFARDVNDRLNLDPTRAGFCPDCSAEVLPMHLQADSKAPEIGWEYYECPDCRTNIAPEGLSDA